MSSPASPARLRLRAGLRLALAAFILLSPAHRVFGGRSPWLPDWVLYRDLGVGLVHARFTTLDTTLDPAREQPLDRFTALGFRRGPTAPRWLTHIAGEPGLHKVARQLCATLPPGHELRVHARIATTSGWAELEHGDRDRCLPQPPHPLRTDTTPRSLHD